MENVLGVVAYYFIYLVMMLCFWVFFGCFLYEDWVCDTCCKVISAVVFFGLFTL